MTDREKMADRAAELFLEKMHWSQAILGACAELFRDEPPSAELMAAMAPFGGGMGSSGQICGSLSGSLAVIGYTLGKTEAKGKDHKLMWKISHKMVTQFAEICQPYGGTNCANIARLNWKNHAAVLNFYKNPNSTRKNCVHVIRETSNFLYDLITEHFPKKD